MARLAKSLEILRDQIDALAPGRDKSSDGWIGDAAHAARKSDHNPDGAGIVRALDITDDAGSGVIAADIAEQVRSDPRVSYVISNRRISNPNIQAGAWRPYDGSNPHTKHCHISVVSDERGDDETPWQVSLSDPTGEVSVKRPRLGLGDTGSAVSEAQKLLGVQVDGVFGKDTQAAVVAFQAAHGLEADGYIGPYTWAALLQQAPTARQTGIVATVFSSSETGAKGAYGDWLDPADLFLALPATLERGTLVRVYGPTGSAVAPVLDKGPWNVSDPYWATGARPQAESGTDTRGRKTNRAGIDLSPALAKAVGIAGKGVVDWEFAAASAPVEPQPVPPPLPQPPVFPFPPFELPGLPAPPAGQYNMPLGDLFSVIGRVSTISGLMQRIPKDLSLDRILAGVEQGLTTIVYGPAPPQPLKGNSMTTVAVPVQSALKSKINWTQVVTGLGQVVNLGMAFAGSLPPQWAVPVAAGLGLAGNVITYIQRTWFTTTVTPSSVA